MTGQLSQEEIDVVFHRLQGQGQEVPFDFHRPDRIAKPQLRTIRLLHEAFARNFATSLSAYLRSDATATLTTVEQVSYRDFLDGLSSPTCMVSLGFQPFGGSGLFDLSPSLVFPILEMILGGKGKTCDTRREITEIEQHLLHTLFQLILDDLEDAWKPAAAVKFKKGTVSTEPRLAEILTPSETVVSIVLQIRMGDVAGFLKLAIPVVHINRMGRWVEQQRLPSKPEPARTEQLSTVTLLKTSSAALPSALSDRLPQELIDSLQRRA